MRGSLGEKMGEGVFADVHAWAPGQVVKLSKPGIPQWVVQHETQMTRAVFAAGGPAPEVLGEVTLDGRFGIVLPRFDGPTLTQTTRTGAIALFVGFPVGVGVGYAWRDRISRKRRLQAAEDWRRAEIDRELARLDIMRAERSDGNPVDEAVAASANTSDRAIAAAIEVGKDPVLRARRKATPSGEEVEKRTACDRKARKAPSKVKLKVVRGDVIQEPAPGGAA